MPSKLSEREAVFACQPSSVQIEIVAISRPIVRFQGLVPIKGLGQRARNPIFRLNSRAFRV
jgi:hypothetical protein